MSAHYNVTDLCVCLAPAVNALRDVDGAYGFYLPVLPQRVACSGNEAVLKNCKFVYTTWCNHALFETAGVRCVEDIVG